ncbi:response regulator transcription factor [Nocardioides maradonensis]
MARLLVVEDEQRIGELLTSALTANGHDVRHATTGEGALKAAASGHIDLALLDLGLPDLDGIDVCRELRRSHPDCVIVVLTARKDEMDVVEGLESGADDYLTKPFRLTELLARVRAHLRRANIAGVRETYQYGDLTIDTAARRALVRGQEIALRPKEFDLLARLALEPDRAVSREALISDVWDTNWYGSTKTLDVHIAALRRRLADTAEAERGQPQLPAIITVRGHGYRLDMSSSTT